VDRIAASQNPDSVEENLLQEVATGRMFEVAGSRRNGRRIGKQRSINIFSQELLINLRPANEVTRQLGGLFEIAKPNRSSRSHHRYADHGYGHNFARRNTVLASLLTRH
jgi:hypothetical protein